MKYLHHLKDDQLLVAGIILISWVSVGILVRKLVSLHIL